MILQNRYSWWISRAPLMTLHDFPIRVNLGVPMSQPVCASWSWGCGGFPSTGCILPIRCSSTQGWLAFIDLEDVSSISFCCFAKSWILVRGRTTPPLFVKTGSWVVFIGTSTLSGAFLTGLKDFVTPLRSVNESGRLFACVANLWIERRVPILEYVGMRRNVKSQLISWHSIDVVLEISP